MPYDDMGDKINITEDYFERAGKTDAIDNAGVRKAKENMIKLLQKQLDLDELDKPKKQY